MFERNEKWIILGLIALAIWYFYKKGAMAKNAPSSGMGSSLAINPFDFGTPGSIVNTADEPGAVQPAQASSPVLFRPAQPSTVPISERISVGQFSYYPAPPVLRAGSPVMAREYLQ